ncbi:MAG: hypothetical protein ACOCRX_04325 [Candidatus Woesearchaeota archaeon]
MKQKTKKTISLLIIIPLIINIIGISIITPVQGKNKDYEDSKEIVTKNIPATTAIEELELDLTRTQYPDIQTLNQVTKKDPIEAEGKLLKSAGVGTVGGVAAGVTTGATMGSVVPGIGTAIGAAIGATVATYKLADPIAKLTTPDYKKYKGPSKKGIELGIQGIMLLYDDYKITPEEDDKMKVAINSLKDAVGIYTETSEDDWSKEIQSEIIQNVKKSIINVNSIQNGIHVSSDDNSDNKREEEIQRLKDRDIILDINLEEDNIETRYQKLKDRLNHAEKTENWSMTLRNKIDRLEDGIDYAQDKNISVRMAKQRYNDALYWAERNTEDKAMNNVDEGLSFVYDEIYYNAKSKIEELESLDANSTILQDMNSDLERSKSSIDGGNYDQAQLKFEKIYEKYDTEYELLHNDMIGELDGLKDKKEEVKTLIEEMSDYMPTEEYLSRVQDIEDEMSKGEKRVDAKLYDEAYEIFSEQHNKLNELEEEIRSKETTRDKLSDELVIEKDKNISTKATSDGIVYYRTEISVKNDSVASLEDIEIKIGEIPENATSYNSYIDSDSNVKVDVNENNEIMLNIISKDAGKETKIDILYWQEMLDIDTTVKAVESKKNKVEYRFESEIYNKSFDKNLKETDVSLDLGMGNIEDYIDSKNLDDLTKPKYHNFIEKDSLMFNISELKPRRTKNVSGNITLNVVDTDEEVAVDNRVRVSQDLTEENITMDKKSNNSKYYIEATHLRLKNNLNETIEEDVNIEVILDALYDEATEVIIVDSSRNEVARQNLEYNDNIIFNKEGLHHTMEEFSVIYKIPNDEVLLESKIKNLEENLDYMSEKVDIAEEYSLKVDDIENDLDNIQNIIDESYDYLDGEFYDDGYDIVEKGNNIISDSREVLEERISEMENTEEKVNIMIELTEDTIDTVENTLNNIKHNELDRLNTSEYEYNLKDVKGNVDEAKKEVDNKDVEEALDIMRDTKKESERVLSNLNSHIDEAITFEMINVNNDLDYLERMIYRAEEYDISGLHTNKNNYNDFTEVFDDIERYRKNDNYSVLITELSNLQDDLKQEINLLSEDIKNTAIGRYDKVKSNIDEVNTNIETGNEKLREYTQVFPFEKVRNNYNKWNKQLSRYDTEINQVNNNIKNINDTCEEIGRYMSLLSEVNSIEERVSEINTNVKEINTKTDSEIENIYTETKQLLKETKDALDIIHNSEDEIKENDLKERIQSNYDMMNQEYNEAKTLYEQERYYEAKQKIKSTHETALEFESQITELAGQMEEEGDSGVETMTGVLMIITILLGIGLFMVSKKQQQEESKGLEGDMRDPNKTEEGYQYKKMGEEDFQ